MLVRRSRSDDLKAAAEACAVRMTCTAFVACMLVVLVMLVMQQAPVFGQGERLPQPTFGWKGADLCIRCHRSEQGDWVDTATTATWRHDAHSRSHLALLSDNPRTQAMEQALGFKAAEQKSCVACHTHSSAEPPIDEETSVLHAGISCETCHGAAEAYLEKHMEKSWRFLDSAEKAAFGMHDLRNPVLKAENCLSCHLGDVSTDRIITHQMYAAGHPPLAGFEMESSSKGMGQHWKRVWEKSEKVQGLAVAAGYHTEAACESQRALIGSLVALKKTATLVHDYAQEAVSLPEAHPWPELAIYDCQSCHHELQVPSWRQNSASRHAVPGRPSLVRWPRQLAGVAMAHAGRQADVDALLLPYSVGLNGRPFGTPDTLLQISEDTNGIIEEAIAGLQGVRRGDASVLWEQEHELIASLSAAGRRSGEFEAARQLGWVMVLALRQCRTWPEDVRAQKIAELTAVLGLDFPGPAYPLPPSEEKPFWQTSLTLASGVRMEQVHQAFLMPAALPKP